jgi:hypothetical protein
MFKAACCIAATVLLFLPVAFWLYSAAPVNPVENAAVADRFVMPEYCRPEPGERLVYLSGIVFLPLVLFGIAFAWRRWGSRLPSPPSYAVLGLEVIFTGGLTVLSWAAFRGNNCFHLRLNQFFLYPLLAVPFVPAVLLVMRWDLGGGRFIRPLLHLAALGLVGVIFLCDVFTDKGPYCTELHFTAVFFPVVQVYEGKALLIDCASQYGLYPQLLLPLFRITSLSILTFTLVMALLTAGSFIALYRFLCRACENKTAAFIGFAALLFNTWFSFVKWANLDLYFQYFPIRLVFPAFLVLMAWRYLRRPTRWLYWTLLAFLAVGVLWNTDAGLPSLLAWTLTLCFAELFGDDWRSAARHIAGHWAATAAALTAVVTLYSGAIRLSYGALPDYGQFFIYQHLYFLSGYYKTPLSPPSTWVLAALVYLAGLAHAAFAVVARRRTPRAIMVFLLSVLGVGLSSYYQGSSNPIVLFLVWWPCLLLLTLFLDDLLMQLKQKPARLFPWFATAALSWFLVGGACSLAPQLPFFGKAIAANYQRMSDPRIPRPLREEADLLARSAPAGHDVVVAAPYSALMHLASKHPAVNPSSLFQMVLMEEFRQLEDRLSQSPSTLVLVDKNTYSLVSWMANDRGLRTLVEFLRARYEIEATTPYCYLFARRSDGQLLLDEKEKSLLHLGVRARLPAKGLTFMPLSTKLPWSVELIVNPATNQGPNAALVGNYYAEGVAGFVIQQETPGEYSLTLGDGKACQHILPFRLRPGEWNYLALVHSDKAFTIYLDGTPVASEDASDLQIQDSPLPLQIGNRIAGDWPFGGEIKEIHVLNRALASDEIAAAARTIRSKLP